MKKKITLIIGNYVFKRSKKLKEGRMVFTCNACEKEGKYLSAVAGTENEEADKYFVIRAPHMKDHVCWVSGSQVAIRRAKNEMYQMVLKEPTRSLKEFFEVVRQNHTAQMDSHTKLLFLQEFPRFSDVKTTLLSEEFIYCTFKA